MVVQGSVLVWIGLNRGFVCRGTNCGGLAARQPFAGETTKRHGPRSAKSLWRLCRLMCGKPIAFREGAPFLMKLCLRFRGIASRNTQESAYGKAKPFRTS